MAILQIRRIGLFRPMIRLIPELRQNEHQEKHEKKA